MDLPLLGEMLRKQREELGITRAALGRRIGATPNYLWMIEEAAERSNGAPSRPSKELLTRWFEVLEISALYRYFFMRFAGYEVGGVLDIPVPDREALLKETAAHLERKAMDETIIGYGLPAPRYDAEYVIADVGKRLIEMGDRAYLAALQYGYAQDLPLSDELGGSYAPESVVWLATFVDPTVPPDKDPGPPYATGRFVVDAMDGHVRGAAYF
jgi:transcriptional regulator with XRE-family HTH domain